ncbi:MAG: carboxypeptidase-like regulatory domain-containing protein [Myxococcota bacterium]
MVGLTWALAAAAAPSIGGQVVDRNGRPIQKAVVSLEPGGIELVTDREGRFTIEYLRDELGQRVKLTRRTSYTLEVLRVGFHPQSTSFDYKKGELVLEPVTLVADTIAVRDEKVNLDPGVGERTEANGHSLEGY